MKQIKTRSTTVNVFISIFAILTIGVLGFVFFGKNSESVPNSMKDLIKGKEYLCKDRGGDVKLVFYKRGKIYTEGVHNAYYKFTREERLLIWSKGQEKSQGRTFLIRKEGDIVYGINERKNYKGAIVEKTAFLLLPVPVGYKELHEIQISDSAGEKSKVVSLGKELLKNEDLDPKIGADVAKILLRNGEIQMAAKGFELFGKKEKVILCNVVGVAITKSIPSGMDVTKEAKIAWKSNCEDGSDLKGLIYRAEAIAYACALFGDYKSAIEYQRLLPAFVQSQQMTQRLIENKETNAIVNFSEMKILLQQYQKKELPKEFKSSIL